MARPLPIGADVGGWTVGTDVVGRGEFGAVLAVSRADVPGEWAMKVCDIAAKGKDRVGKKGVSQQSIMLFNEYTLYASVLAYPGSRHILRLPPRAPQGEAHGKCFLVLPRLRGGTLNDALERCEGRPQWPTLANVAVQLLEALEYVHAAQYVFVDVNPGNIMFGASAASSAAAIVTTSAKGKGSGSASSSATPPLAGESCYLVDFGMAQRYTAFMGVPVPATVNGTPLYTSVASLLGWDACPRNDLESLAYLLYACAGGEAALPWSGAGSQDAVDAAKRAAVIGAAATAAPAAAGAGGGKGKAKAAAATTSSGGPALSPKGLLAHATSHLTARGVPAVEIAALNAYASRVLALRPGDAIDYGGLRAIFAPHATSGLLQWKPAPLAAAAARDGRRRSGSSATPASPPPPASPRAVTPAGIAGRKRKRGDSDIASSPAPEVTLPRARRAKPVAAAAVVAVASSPPRRRRPSRDVTTDDEDDVVVVGDDADEGEDAGSRGHRGRSSRRSRSPGATAAAVALPPSPSAASPPPPKRHKRGTPAATAVPAPAPAADPAPAARQSGGKRGGDALRKFVDGHRITAAELAPKRRDINPLARIKHREATRPPSPPASSAGGGSSGARVGRRRRAAAVDDDHDGYVHASGDEAEATRLDDDDDGGDDDGDSEVLETVAGGLAVDASVQHYSPAALPAAAAAAVATPAPATASSVRRRHYSASTTPAAGAGTDPAEADAGAAPAPAGGGLIGRLMSFLPFGK